MFLVLTFSLISFISEKLVLLTIELLVDYFLKIYIGERSLKFREICYIWVYEALFVGFLSKKQKFCG